MHCTFSLNIRRLLLIALMLLLIISAKSLAASNTDRLLLITDLAQTSQLTKSNNLPILDMFTTDGCPYCELLKEDFLSPMIISGDYGKKILIRELHVSAGNKIINFHGQKVDSTDFARKYRIDLYPSTIFIDATGNELVPKIIGITTPSLFGGSLDSAIDTATGLLRGK